MPPNFPADGHQPAYTLEDAQEGGDGFLCPYPGCHKSFSKKFNLKAHLRLHTGDKPFACSCGKRYMWQSSLCTHQRRCASLGTDEQLATQRFASKRLRSDLDQSYDALPHPQPSWNAQTIPSPLPLDLPAHQVEQTPVHFHRSDHTPMHLERTQTHLENSQGLNRIHTPPTDEAKLHRDSVTPPVASTPDTSAPQDDSAVPTTIDLSFAEGEDDDTDIADHQNQNYFRANGSAGPASLPPLPSTATFATFTDFAQPSNAVVAPIQSANGIHQALPNPFQTTSSGLLHVGTVSSPTPQAPPSNQLRPLSAAQNPGLNGPCPRHRVSSRQKVGHNVRLPSPSEISVPFFTDSPGLAGSSAWPPTNTVTPYAPGGWDASVFVNAGPKPPSKADDNDAWKS